MDLVGSGWERVRATIELVMNGNYVLNGVVAATSFPFVGLLARATYYNFQ